MSMQEMKTEAHMVRMLWSTIKQHKTGSVPAMKMVKLLTTEIAMTEAEAEVLLHNATEDGFIEMCGGNTGNSIRNISKSPTRSYRIPSDPGESINELPHDLYCYECHSPLNLQKCSDCPRVFHEHCMRYNDVSTAVARTNRSPTNQHETTNDSGIVASDPSLTTNEAAAAQADLRENPEPSVEAKPALKTEHANLCNDTKSTALDGPDVICIGEVRPPSRRKKRLISSYNKPEADIHIESEREKESSLWCTSCRLLRTSALRDPPLQLNEINYLLKFIFARIKTWITADTYSPLPFSSISMPSKKEFEFFEKKCLKFPKKLDNIDFKLNTTGYKTLTEFQCDIMDIRHSIGILYGEKSAEHEAASYLLRDCKFELSEIRNCPDCYRHSNEKTNEYWFCKPCIPRHELVFAKQIGYTHWPAKVIKVENGKYDVRFFGKKHLRAVIDAIHVLPIDTDIASLKIKKSTGFNKAMDELHKHQELLQWPLGQFSFEAERQNPVDLSGLHPSVDNNKKKRGPKGKKAMNTTSNADEDAIHELSSSLNTSRPLHVSTTNGGASEGPLIMQQISPVVRLKRAKNQSGMSDITDDNSIGVSPSKKSRPYSSSTPLKKRAIVRGRKRRTSQTNSDTNSTAPSNQTTDETSSIEGRTLKNQTTKQGTTNKVKSKLGKPKQDIIDNLIRELQAEKCSHTICNLVATTFQAEMERSANRIKQLNRVIAENKKKQWCYHCGKEAMYHCCWNTAYCSTECQQEHWQMEHKKTCRRKR